MRREFNPAVLDGIIRTLNQRIYQVSSNSPDRMAASASEEARLAKEKADAEIEMFSKTMQQVEQEFEEIYDVAHSAVSTVRASVGMSLLGVYNQLEFLDNSIKGPLHGGQYDIASFIKGKERLEYSVGNAQLIKTGLSPEEIQNLIELGYSEEEIVLAFLTLVSDEDREMFKLLASGDYEAAAMIDADKTTDAIYLFMCEYTTKLMMADIAAGAGSESAENGVYDMPRLKSFFAAFAAREDNIKALGDTKILNCGYGGSNQHIHMSRLSDHYFVLTQIQQGLIFEGALDTLSEEERNAFIMKSMYIRDLWVLTEGVLENSIGEDRLNRLELTDTYNGGINLEELQYSFRDGGFSYKWNHKIIFTEMKDGEMVSIPNPKDYNKHWGENESIWTYCRANYLGSEQDAHDLIMRLQDIKEERSNLLNKYLGKGFVSLVGQIPYIGKPMEILCEVAFMDGAISGLKKGESFLGDKYNWSAGTKLGTKNTVNTFSLLWRSQKDLNTLNEEERKAYEKAFEKLFGEQYVLEVGHNSLKNHTVYSGVLSPGKQYVYHLWAKEGAKQIVGKDTDLLAKIQEKYKGIKEEIKMEDVDAYRKLGENKQAQEILDILVNGGKNVNLLEYDVLDLQLAVDAFNELADKGGVDFATDVIQAQINALEANPYGKSQQ